MSIVLLDWWVMPDVASEVLVRSNLNWETRTSRLTPPIKPHPVGLTTSPFFQNLSPHVPRVILDAASKLTPSRRWQMGYPFNIQCSSALESDDGPSTSWSLWQRARHIGR